MDRIVSSYTPTLRALRYARQRPTLPGKHHGPVVVGLPSTRGQSDLPGVAREIGDLRARFPHGQFLIGADATRQAVLDALPDRPWVHFACHGTQNIQNPQDGQLVLHDAPLMIRDIGAMHLQQGELAFLSACQTARGGVTIADEAVTLTAGLQLAGYRHVIGTLWNIADSHAPDIANDVYARISANRGAESGTSGAATLSTPRSAICVLVSLTIPWSGPLSFTQDLER
jgi:CHAT domain-containing protein